MRKTCRQPLRSYSLRRCHRRLYRECHAVLSTQKQRRPRRGFGQPPAPSRQWHPMNARPESCLRRQCSNTRVPMYLTSLLKARTSETCLRQWVGVTRITVPGHTLGDGFSFGNLEKSPHVFLITATRFAFYAIRFAFGSRHENPNSSQERTDPNFNPGIHRIGGCIAPGMCSVLLPRYLFF